MYEANLDLKKTVEKIEKILLLSQSPNETEALQAFKKAQELMLRHNLSMTDFERVKAQKVEKQVLYSSGKLRIWKNILAYAIAKSNHCLCYSQKGSAASTFGLIGRPSNIDGAKVQFEYLAGTIEKLSKSSQGDRRYKSSLKLGVAVNLHGRILEIVEQQQEEGICATDAEFSPNSSALAVRSLYDKLNQENLEFAGEMLKSKKKPRKPAIASPEGFLDGVELGENISLSQQENLD